MWGNSVKNLAIQNDSDIKNYLILTLIYVFAWGLMLLNLNGRYGDDWLFTNNNFDAIKLVMQQHGSRFMGSVYIFIFSYFDVWIFRLITFLSFLVTGLVVYHLLKRLDFINKSDAFYITAIIMVFPSNEMRVTMNTAASSFTPMIFMLGFLAMNYSFVKRNLLLRIISLIIFFSSFILNSLLVLYVIPILYAAYQDKKLWLNGDYRYSLRSLTIWGLSKLDFIFLPFVFFAFRLLFLDIGKYKGYNEVTIGGLINSIPKTLYAFYSAFIAIIDSTFSSFTILLFPLSFIILKMSKHNNLSENKANYVLLFILGGLIFYVGAYPYFVVNKLLETTNRYCSRDQVLICFGAGMMVYSIVQYIFKDKFQKAIPAILAIVIAFFIGKDIEHVVGYHLDWVKSDMIINQLKTIKDVELNKGKAFIFVDRAKMYNKEDRIIPQIEVSGWLSKAFDDKTRLGILDDDKHVNFNSFQRGHNRKVENIDDYPGYPEGEIVGRIIIESNNFKLSLVNKLRIILYSAFNRDHYLSFVNSKELIKLTYEPT